MFRSSVCRDYQLEHLFLDLSCIGSKESGWDHVDGVSASLPLSCYCEDHCQLSRASFSDDECFTVYDPTLLQPSYVF